jgi:hydroxylaminobenzene mutase
MGLVLLAVHLTVPDRPDWITAFIAFGTVVNPLLFLPLAYNADASKTLPYRALTLVSFVSLSVGLPALAIHATL